MIVSASERRNVLKLLNVSEAARQLGVDVFRLHRDIRAKKLSAPKIRLGKRLYFGPSDLEGLRTHYTKGKLQ
jgi:hypothetical protein